MSDYEELFPNEIVKYISGLSGGSLFGLVVVIIIIAVILLFLYIGVFILFLKLKDKIISHFEKKNGKSLTLQFIERAATVAIVVYFVVIPLGGDQIARSLLGSTAVVAAIVGFAAQDTIKDMIAGLQISIYKPFDVGSRIELDDGTTGVVELISLKHVVLVLIDTTRVIIPNSKVNSMKVVNYSFGEVPKSVFLKYPISFHTDVEKAKAIISKVICENPLTLNTDEYDKNVPNSRMVYFLEVKESTFIMGATVRFPANIKSEVAKDEINTSVIRALRENGIEMPYQHLDVRMN